MNSSTATLWRLITSALCLLALLYSFDAQAAEPGVRRFALVVGANDGGEGRAVLRYAESDAARFAEVMRSFGGVKADDAFIVRHPDVAAMRAAIDGLEQRLSLLPANNRGRVEVIFYYSGHSDEQGLLLSDDRMRYRELRKSIDALSADVRIIVLDSCSAGSLTRAKGGVKRAPFLVDASNDVKGHAFLTSSSEDEVAQESDRIGGSFFTHYLLTGLRGAADVTEDRRVTLNEAYQFAFQETLARTESTRGGPQHAGYEIQLTGTGDLVLTDLRAPTATLKFAAHLNGRVYVHSRETKTVVAELAKPAGRVIELKVEPGAYDVLIEQNGEVREAIVSVEENSVQEVELDHLQLVMLEDTVARGAGSPFPEPPPRDGGVEDGYQVIPVNVGLVTGAELNQELRSGDLPIKNNFSFGGSDAIAGAQLSGLSGWVHRDLNGLQFSGGGSFSYGAFDGAQISGIFNYARDFKGLQLSAISNTAQRVNGAQIGLVNIADHVNGVQIGVVNISEESDASIGLINYSHDGILEGSVWASETAFANVGFRIGSKHFYTMISVGSQTLSEQNTDSDWVAEAAFTVGGRFFASSSVFFDLDIQAAQFLDSNGWHTNNALGRLRLAVNYRFFSHLTLYAGLSANVFVEFEEDNSIALSGGPVPLTVVHERSLTEDIEVSVFPGFFGGISF